MFFEKSNIILGFSFASCCTFCFVFLKQVSMAEAVLQALVEVIAKAGKIDLDKAKVVVARMKEEGRYTQDIFGQ